MPLLSLNEFSQSVLPKSGRLLGCDVGTKTIGLAVSDQQKKIASPLQVIHRSQWKKDSQTLINIIQENDVIGIVIGFPLNMNGTEGPRCQSVRQFASNLLGLLDLSICLWDERLSTMAVTRTLLEADLSREKRKQVIDKVAAAYILQGLLDALANKSYS